MSKVEGNMIYELYGKVHKTVKKILGRSYSPKYRLVSISSSIIVDGYFHVMQEDNFKFFNEKTIELDKIKKHDLFPIENVVKIGTFRRLDDSYRIKYKKIPLGVPVCEAVDFWHEFIRHSVIPEGYRNAGLSYAGYIMEAQSWCLPSWVWINAATVRMYCKCGNINKAQKIADILVSLQKPEGGWIVRFDYDSKGAIPIWAPNDSAYVANNACLEMYLATKETKYLEAAELCGKWIMETTRPDGMVYIGFNMRESEWQKKHNIVDVGFTGGLFSRLYQVTEKKEYKIFLDRFIQRYIELFFIENKGFATSLDKNNHTFGGMFSRGQAWALEGLIPYYCLDQNIRVKNAINSTIETLIKCQTKDGGWSYNLTRKLMGIDCKAIPIIALSLWKWYELYPERTDCRDAAIKSLKWCAQHTAKEGQGKGGIFSYCTEGAIVHNMYTSTAFVYACAYAIELAEAVKRDIK